MNSQYRNRTKIDSLFEEELSKSNQTKTYKKFSLDSTKNYLQKANTD